VRRRGGPKRCSVSIGRGLCSREMCRAHWVVTLPAAQGIPQWFMAGYSLTIGLILPSACAHPGLRDSDGSTEVRERIMERRAFLAGSTAAVVGATAPKSAQAMYLGHDPAGVRQPLSPSELEAAVARLRKQFLAEFDPAYVEHVTSRCFAAERIARARHRGRLRGGPCNGLLGSPLGGARGHRDAA
jgi:hypothetical protein